MRDLAFALPSWDGEGTSRGTRTGSVANRKLLMTEQFLRCRNCERGSDTFFLDLKFSPERLQKFFDLFFGIAGVLFGQLVLDVPGDFEQKAVGRSAV